MELSESGSSIFAYFMMTMIFYRRNPDESGEDYRY